MIDKRTQRTLYARIAATSSPLAELAPGRLMPALDAGLAVALSVDRPTRDRLVIFDPSSAPFVRPLILGEDLRAWHSAASGRWIVAVPSPEAPTLAERHPALARHLAALPAPAAEAWWAVPPEAVALPAPRIIVGAGGPCGWDESAALIGGAVSVIAPAEPYWLGLLGSRIGRRLRAEVELAAFPVPDAPGPARANLEGLALSAATLTREIDELERAVLRRLVADFGPPGVRPGPRLSRWWELSFAELHEAVLAELRNDIPERFRPTWAEIHADHCATHTDASARLGATEVAIETQVAALFGLEAHEVES